MHNAIGWWWEINFMARISWRKLGIDRIISQNIEKNPLVAANAAKIWENAYRQALRRARKAGVQNINISRELFVSSFYKTESGLFTFSEGTTFAEVNRIQIADKYKEDVQKELIKARFAGMADAYPKVNEILDDYLSGNISYDEFRDKIKEFRETDEDYLKSGSR